jgi:hypothetical protein
MIDCRETCDEKALIVNTKTRLNYFLIDQRKFLSLDYLFDDDNT